MADMIVSGAGTSTVNGTYVENGTLNEKPLYIMQGQVDYPRIYFDPAGAWRISVFNTYKGILYYSNESVDTPDLCTTWTVSIWGTSPAPTVTADSSGQSLTGSSASRPTLESP